MPLPFNPLQLQTYDISNKDQARMFVLQLANMLTQALTPNGIASILNGSGVINGSALVPGSVTASDLTIATGRFLAVSTNQTLDCTGACMVSVYVTYSAAITLSLTHVASAVPVTIRATNTSGGALILKCTATNPAGTAYTVASDNSGAVTDFGVTGVSMGAGGERIWVGSAVPGGPNLNLGEI